MSLVIMMCCRSDVMMASVLTPRMMCVTMVTSLLVLYLLIGIGGSSDHPSDLDKREVRDWDQMDLLARDLPSDIKERVTRVKIEESHRDIHGTSTFTQVSTIVLLILKRF